MDKALQDAISELLSKTQADGSVLHVAEEAVRLARRHGGDSREIAILLTNAGIGARLNMELSMPPYAIAPVIVMPPAACEAEKPGRMVG